VVALLGDASPRSGSSGQAVSLTASVQAADTLIGEAFAGRQARAALAQRLRAVAEVLLDEVPLPDRDTWRDAAALLDPIFDTVHPAPTPDRIWLLLVAVSTVWPDASEVRECVREFQLRSRYDTPVWFMRFCLALAQRSGSPDRRINIVRDGVLVDVNFSAKHDLHTGIQRVVRMTMPRWRKSHDIVPVVWTPAEAATRSLTPPEEARVFDWSASAHRSAAERVSEQDRDWTLVVPWRSVVVLAEVPMIGTCGRLAAMAESSGNDVVAIGYDCIPIVSADLVPTEADRFVRYLSVIRHARRLAGISVSATTEFGGFASMLPTQGLPGPRVVECALPVEMVAPATDPDGTDGEPLVLSVGSFEPRKNHLALLYAAETLWSEGHRFRLLLIGGGGDSAHVRRKVRGLKSRGRHVSLAVSVSEADLASAYRKARFTVFTSLHEGYGLPVAESLSLGTPVITTNYGSTRELGAGGGAVLVDPRDDVALVAAMRELLTDDERIHQLHAEIRHRPARTWDDYAAALWQCLVVGRPEAALNASAAAVHPGAGGPV
jgi:glycosyltransferase involved in cell wall biosynthesis